VTRELAERLLPFFSDPGFREAIEAYAKHRMDVAGRSLEQASDLLIMGRQQGAMRELRNLFTIRDEIKAHAKQ
jgi:hypothetical protein